MTLTRMLGLFGLLVGLALGLTMAAGQGRRSQKHKVELIVFGPEGYLGAKGCIGKVVRDGDRFVAPRFRQGEGAAFHGNFEPGGDDLKVDDKYLGYDLRGENKNVLVREWDRDSVQWELVRERIIRQEKAELRQCFRVKNGELKGWWIGLGPLEEVKGDHPQRERRPRARLILVKDKKDAAEFDWEDPKDEGR